MAEIKQGHLDSGQSENSTSIFAGTDSQVGLEVLPFIPSPAMLWKSLRLWIWVAFGVLILAALPDLIVDFWFFKSMGKESIFWTNFNSQLALFLLTLVLFSLADYLPIRAYAVSPTLRNAAIHLGLWSGIFAGWLVSRNYQTLLLFLNRQPFGEVDPVFGHDIGFYVFVVPALWTFFAIILAAGLDTAVSFLIGRFDQLKATGQFERQDISFWAKCGMMITPGLNYALGLVGISAIGETFLSRYSLLLKDNEESGVRVGAEFIDLDGFISTLNVIHLSVFLGLCFMVIMGYALQKLFKLYDPFNESKDGFTLSRLRGPVRFAVALLTIDFLFFGAVIIKDHVWVQPNEPSIQIPYIQRHMDATLKGFRLNDVQTVDWKPPEQPISVTDILASKTVQNAPLMTPFVSFLEEPPDVQHYERIQTSDSMMVFGPVFQIFQQEQQLRPYYHVLNVDGVRYNINGEKKMFASAVRETPSLAFLGPKEWLRYWGSAALMFTHGFGLVMAPVNEVNAEGGLNYSVYEVPPKYKYPELETEPRVYFGEGMKDDYILTNIRHLKELDRPTNQFREETVYPPEIGNGIPVDSWFKRLIFAAHTKDVTAFLFSDFIDHSKTRIHINRTPMRRAARLARFLFLDTNIYAFAADKQIQWLVNGLTTTDQYPYSFSEFLGDKADERAVEKFPERLINYAEDSVKVTVNAYTGETRFFKMTDDPIINAWAKTYPDLFEAGNTMSDPVRAQLTYPLQWFHIQFDDVYKRYHQMDPIEFYNVEDLWDDADEVLGSLGRGLEEFGTTDQMTFSYEGSHMLVDPADLPAGVNIGNPGQTQFAMMMPFTCEGCRNLRSLIVAYQDPESYGKLVNYRISQTTFVPGPEQADNYIDDDAQANQQITMWIRHGSEVLRGHTILVPVKGDVMYIEPLWISSLQNPLPEIKLFSVVYRGRTTIGTTLEKAITTLGISEAQEQKENELPWFEEDYQKKEE